jgi:hypothetical protein
MITLRANSQTHLYPTSELPGPVLNQIKSRLTFDNPRYLENERRQFSNWDVPREIKGYRVEGDSLITPWGFTRQLVGILHRAGVGAGVQH